MYQERQPLQVQEYMYKFELFKKRLVWFVKAGFEAAPPVYRAQ